MRRLHQQLKHELIVCNNLTKLRMSRKNDNSLINLSDMRYSTCIASNRVYSKWYGILALNYSNLSSKKSYTNPDNSQMYRHLSTKRDSGKYKSLCPYEVLNVSRHDTQKEIKLAYFKEAKKSHPDLNPNDAQAKIKFQIIADAYSILSDASKKNEYDTYGTVRGYANFGKASKNTSYQEYGGQTHDNSYSGGFHQNAEEVFRRAQEDVDVIREAFQEYVEDLKAELSYAMDRAASGDWVEVWNLAKAYKGLFIGVVLPAVVFLRFPALIAVAMRLAVFGSQILFVGLVRSGNLEVTVNWLWRRVVALALEKRKRKR